MLWEHEIACSSHAISTIMGLEKAIQSGQEYRKTYRHSKLYAYSCRNHGSCPWCKGNRLHNSTVKDEANSNELKLYFKNI
jgi:hypothetical protein